MHLLVNGETCEVSGGANGVTTLKTFLHDRGLADAACAVEVNRELVPKRCHGEHKLKDGDVVEIVTLVGGG